MLHAIEHKIYVDDHTSPFNYVIRYVKFRRILIFKVSLICYENGKRDKTKEEQQLYDKLPQAYSTPPRGSHQNICSVKISVN